MDTEFISSMVQPGRGTQGQAHSVVPAQLPGRAGLVCEGQAPSGPPEGLPLFRPLREPGRNDRALRMASVSALSLADSVILGDPADHLRMVPVGDSHAFCPLTPAPGAALYSHQPFYHRPQDSNSKMGILCHPFSQSPQSPPAGGSVFSKWLPGC